MINVGTVLNGFSTPKELHCAVVNDALLHSGINHAVDGLAALAVSVAHNRTGQQATLLIDVGHQHIFVEEGVVLGEFFVCSLGTVVLVGTQCIQQRVALGNWLFLNLGNLLGCLFLGLDAADRSDKIVNLFKHPVSLGIVIGQPELQLGGTLEEFADTLRVFHTGKLNKDTLGGAQLLNSGLRNAELVNTLTEDLVGAVIGTGGLFLDDLDNSIVIVVQLDAVTQLGVEIGGQLYIGVHLADGIVEQGNEIPVGGLLLGGNGHIDSLVEHRILGMTGQGAHHIDGGNLKHHVHTAFQVKTEVNLACLALTVGVAQINFLTCHGIKVLGFAVNQKRILQCLSVQGITVGFCVNQVLCCCTLNIGICRFRCILLYPACNKRKRQLIQTD